ALLLGPVVPNVSRAGECCSSPDNGSGTATLPPASGGCYYYGSTEIVDGLPGGDTIQINGYIGFFSAVSEIPGGTLSGTTSQGFNAVFFMSMTGTGSITGFSRNINIPLVNERIDWGPRVPYAVTQSATAQYMALQGQITSDLDFDLLRVTGGDLFGMPAPGAIELNSFAGGWLVSGFFSLWHRIDFVGSPISAYLAGRSGSTTRQRPFTLCNFQPVPVEPSTWSNIKGLLAD
ncbi:MAG TPA: hypothetical protein VF720_01925, partial [Candidatus Eisenbacteria bacterium]